jgi:hypothetical protein
MSTRRDLLLNHVRVRHVIDPAAEHSNECRRPAWNDHAKHEPPDLHHAPRLPKGTHAIFPLQEMVKRSHQQHGVSAHVGPGECAGVTNRRGRQTPSVVRRRDYVLGHGVQEMDDMSQPGQPRSLPTGPPAYVVDHCLRLRKNALQQLTGANELELRDTV